MAGIICFVAGPEDDSRRLPGRLDRALNAGLHFDAIARRVLLTNDRVAIGVLLHSQIPGRSSWCSADGFHVACYGDPHLSASDDKRAEAADILGLYRGHGFRGLDGVLGDYVLCLVDEAGGELIIQNDRRCSMPACYASTLDGFALAPEAKCLFEAGIVSPGIDQQSVLEFVTHGFPMPGRTMFNDVRSMEPASRIRVDLKTMKVFSENYWSLRFAPDPSLGYRAASEILYQEVLRAVEAETEEIGAGLGLFLTGGGDSRGIVSALSTIGRLPALSLTWGGTDTIPKSDPVIARELARQYGFENRFCRISPEDLPSNCRRWTYISELSADNLGFFAAPPDLFYRHGAGECGVFLIGDELFGHGGGFSTSEEAVRYLFANYQIGPNSWLRGVLGKKGMEVASGCFDRSTEAILDRCDAEEPRDVVDWLTYYVHRPRWSYSAGNFKEPVIPVRRPFLRDRMVDFVCQLPRRLRNDKAAYYSMLRRFMRDTLHVPRPRADSLFDWDSLVRSKAGAGRYVLKTILDGHLFEPPLEGIFDRAAVEKLLESFLASHPVRKTGSDYRFHAVNARRWLTRHGVTSRLLGGLNRALRSGNIRAAASPGSVIRRLFLVALFTECVNEGVFGDDPVKKIGSIRDRESTP